MVSSCMTFVLSFLVKLPGTPADTPRARALERNQRSCGGGRVDPIRIATTPDRAQVGVRFSRCPGYGSSIHPGAGSKAHLMFPSRLVPSKWKEKKRTRLMWG